MQTRSAPGGGARCTSRWSGTTRCASSSCCSTTARIPGSPTTARAGAGKDSPRHAAIWRARHETAKLLIARGAPLEQRNGHRETPLSYSVRAALQSEWTRERNAETVEALLTAGADPREVGLPTGWPALDTLIERHLPGR